MNQTISNERISPFYQVSDKLWTSWINPVIIKKRAYRSINFSKTDLISLLFLGIEVHADN